MRKLIMVVGVVLLAACATVQSDEPLTEDNSNLESGGDEAGENCVNTDTYECIGLYYGTNRKQADDDPSGQKVYDPVAANKTTLGRLTVTIPRTRRQRPGAKIEMIGSEKKSITEADRAEVFAVWGNRQLPKSLFLSLSRAELANDPSKKKAIVYVHGFNTTFRNASFRAGQIKYDLDFDGPVYFFSWPANGQWGVAERDYLSDLDDADLSAGPLADFLVSVREAVGTETKIYAIAHSMGARVVMNALKDIALDKGKDYENGPLVNRLVLAAGDVDRSVFLKWNDQADSLIGDVTIYTSNNDKALRLSRAIRNLLSFRKSDPKTRIGINHGEMGPTVLRSAKAATIDISKYNEQWFSSLVSLNHANYVDNNVGVQDIKALVNDAPLDPELRDTRFRLQCAGPQLPYWVFNARRRAPGPC